MKNSPIIWVGGSALLLPFLIILVPWYPLQLTVGLFLLALMPGYALLWSLWPDGSTLTNLERGLIAVPVSFSLTIVYLLLLVLAHLPLNVFFVAGGLGVLTLLFTSIAWRMTRRGSADRGPVSNTPEAAFYALRSAWPLLLILLLAALLRLVNIHYSDYQGDEADILLRAVWLVYGQTEAIWTHSKGPGEILLLDAIGALTGRFDEQTARLPFAVAGVMSMGLLAWLGRRLFNPGVGWIAGLLAAIDGVFISYARTAQYQSLVLLLTLAAIYCFYRFYQSQAQSYRWHGLGAFLLAASFLFHFEVILLLPIAIYLTLAPIVGRGRQEQRARGGGAEITASSPHHSRVITPSPHHLTNHRLITSLWPSLLIFFSLVAMFYVPFLLHPSIRSTRAYLENRVGGGSVPPFNNLGHFFYEEALKYNSAYYVILFNILLVGVAAAALAGRQGNKVARGQSLLRWLSGILLLSGAALALTESERAAALLLALGFGLLFALLILSPHLPSPLRVLWLWLAPPFWVYVFLVSRPGKHHYLFLGALTLLVAWAAVQSWQWAAERWPILNGRAGRGLTIALGLILVAIFIGNSSLIFLRSDLEYILTYPAHKSAFYPTDANFPYGTRIGFGYPFRLGWQLVGQLRRMGQLNGDWGGNDDGNAPRWYMLGVPYSPCYPHYVLQGEITYKGDSKFDVPFDPANFGYHPIYRLWGNNRLRMTILEFDPTGQMKTTDLYETPRIGPPVTVADFAATIAAQAATSHPEIVLEPSLVLGEGSELKNNAPPEYVERAKQLNGRVALTGYDVDENYAQPGGIVPVTLYWQAQNLLNLRYKVFVHLITTDGQTRAQADDFPVCGSSHANTWLPGNLIADRHLLKLPPDLTPGTYTLLVGMYEPDLNLRLNYFDEAGNEQGNSLTVGTLSVH